MKKDKGQTEKRPVWEIILIFKEILKSDFSVTFFDTELTFSGKKIEFFPQNVNSAIIYHLLCKQKQWVFAPNNH